MIDSKMQISKLFFLLYTCFGCLFLNTANAQDNVCLQCTDVLKNCDPPKGLLHKYEVDDSKVVSLGKDSPNPALEGCLKPDMNITENLDMVVCSETRNNTCGVIAKKSTDKTWIKNACLSCWRYCDCDKVKASDAVKEDGLSNIYLALFSIVVYLNNLYI